jgi:REP element-mobilizing transposase RayT
MPRPPRVDLPGVTHHVFNRGARRVPTFRDQQDCVLFVGLLGLLPEKYHVIVHGYALMPNHFHLIIEAPRGNLAPAMRWLTSNFVKRVNQREKWDGPLFRGRYKNRVVTDDLYLRHLLAYVHLNPVRAHLAASPDGASWTSHDAYAGLAPRPEWLTVRRVLDLFGSKVEYRNYLHEMQVKRLEPPDSFAADELWRRNVLGEELVVAVDEPMSADAVLAGIERVTSVPREQLRVDSTATRSARWLAAWLLIDAGLTLAEAGAHLGVRRNSVSRLAAAGRKHRHDPPWSEWIAGLNG